jgi:hypothetical protein
MLGFMWDQARAKPTIVSPIRWMVNNYGLIRSINLIDIKRRHDCPRHGALTMTALAPSYSAANE